MRYNRLKKLVKVLSKPIFKMIAYLFGIFVFVSAIQYFNEEESFLDAVISIIKNDTTASVFVLGILTLIFKSVKYWFDKNVEESEKTESDHRKIIMKYKEHEGSATCGFSNVGAFLQIRYPNLDTTKIAKNPSKDKFSKEYIDWQKAYKDSGFPQDKKSRKLENKNAVLTLSSISVYANNKQNPIKDIYIYDKDERYTLPQYVHTNAENLLQAHSTTALKNNQTTIRLKDAKLDGNKLSFFTERSTYYEMLMTNRCMDYEHQPNITLRQVYEYKDRISRFENSKMSNQIGINGLIITNDGYLLIEKRDLSKSTWKDKFSQPISLAMKKVDVPNLEVGENRTEAVTKIFNKIISKTLKNNYAINYSDDETQTDYTFSIEENFLGLARDLLEGGKPNLYFIINLKISALELKERMEANARLVEASPTGEKPLDTGKLKSDFYLIHNDCVEIDCNYSMSLKRKNRKIGRKNKNRNGWIYINRIRRPRSKRIKCIANGIKKRGYWLFKRSYCKECSEALLVSIAYKQLFNKTN